MPGTGKRPVSVGNAKARRLTTPLPAQLKEEGPKVKASHLFFWLFVLWRTMHLITATTMAKPMTQIHCALGRNPQAKPLTRVYCEWVQGALVHPGA